jgi:hypothetical protein
VAGTVCGGGSLTRVARGSLQGWHGGAIDGAGARMSVLAIVPARVLASVASGIFVKTSRNLEGREPNHARAVDVPVPIEARTSWSSDGPSKDARVDACDD